MYKRQGPQGPQGDPGPAGPQGPQGDQGPAGPQEEFDPVFTAWDKSTGISITESQITDLGSYLTEETDPAVEDNFDFTDAVAGDLLQFDGTKWVKLTPTYICLLYTSSQKTVLIDTVDPALADVLFEHLKGVDRVDYILSLIHILYHKVTAKQ